MKPTIKLTIKLALCSLALAFLAFIPRDENPLDKLVSNLQLWRDSIPQEKVYLHTDKPYYALGDTIWFKGYLTIGARHQLSSLSGAVYVELVNERDSLLQQLKLPVTAGMVMGNFILGDDFREGSYRIRAYTQWMANAGADYFYDHTFTVGDLIDHNILTKADYRYKDVDGKPALTATLNYSDKNGGPVANRDVRYILMINKKVAWQRNTKTDAQGNVSVNIPNTPGGLAGAYIHTILQSDDKSTVTRDFAVKAQLAQSDVQFFPESGTLVNGLLSRVAFKAVGIDGLGVNIKGQLVDETGAEVLPFETLHAGMGSFLLRPQAGKTYSAKITFDDGSTKTLPLPAVSNDGYTLNVYQPGKDSVLVRIQASAGLQQSNTNLIIHAGGEVVFASPVKIEGLMTSVLLDKKSFPTGIAQFTLFNAAGDPINERIAFIRSNDLMNLNIKTAKTTYNSKERVQVALQSKDGNGMPAAGNFSVSVIDEGKVPIDENKESTIFSNILLTSDLKGYVEQPNYYFANKSDDVDRALDNLMLTQGYRRFTWKALNSTVAAKPVFPVEGLGTTMSGRVTTLAHRPQAGASVIMMALRAGVTKVTTADSNGRFKFPGYFITDSNKITIQARNGKSDHVIVIMDTIPKIRMSHNPNMPDVSTNVAATLKEYLGNVNKEDDAYEKMGLLDKMHRLREVRIKARKPAPPPYKDQMGLRVPDGHADQTYLIPADHQEGASLLMCFQTMLTGVVYQQRKTQSTVVNNYPYAFVPGSGLVPLNVVLDGRLLTLDEVGDIFDNDSIDPDGVAKVDIIRTNQALINYLGGPTLMIYTKRDYVRKNYNPAVVNFTPKGFNKVREFYSPRYGRPGNAEQLPDLRTTVFWSPYLKTDSAGNTSFNFYNADGPGKYRVVIEGINAQGQLGRAIYHYTVDAGQAVNNNLLSTVTDKNITKITTPLDAFNKRLPLEKVYLHTDKPYYNTGDTLWFKSYLLDGVNLTASRLSGLEYIELVDDSASVVRRVSVNVKDGLAWGQIPLPAAIFKEGGYTLRAYTNWMQNFGGDYIFTQHFYIGVPATDAWLVNSAAKLEKVGDKDQVQINLKLTQANNPLAPIASKKVEVKLYDEYHYISKEEVQTGPDGSLNISHELAAKADGRRVRLQITSLDKADNFKVVQVPLVLNRDQKIDLQFLPEGGSLVAGLNSVVGFKAIAEDGSGTAVVGGIYDSKDNEVVSFTPLHNGMGSFLFTPHAGETYTARISQPIAKGYKLPKIQPKGTVLHIYNPEQGDDLKVDIAGANSLPTDSACYLIGTSRGVIYYSQKVDLAKPSLMVAKNLFPTGIAKLTLFEGMTPLNERAVFIDNGDQLKISLKSNKASYVKRDSVALDIQVKDKSGLPVQGNFSLAVTDDSQIKPDSLGNYGIAPSLLLNADLKGNIESPGYYINRKDNQAWQALDNLMLTQGWTGYDWNDVFTRAKPVKYQAEKEFKITGLVKNITNKPSANQTVLISSQKPSFVNTVVTDSTGRYIFDHLPPIDSGSFFLQANNAKGKHISFGSISIDNRFKPLHPRDSINVPVKPWYVNTDARELNFVSKQIEMNKDNVKYTGRLLNEVQIKAKKVIPGSRYPFGAGYADMAFDEKDIKASATNDLYELLKQKLPGFRVLGATKTGYRGEVVFTPLMSFNGYGVILHMNGGPVILNIDAPDVEEDVNLEKAAIASTRPGRPHPEYSVLSPESEVIQALRDYKIPDLTGLEVAYSRKYTNRYAGPKFMDDIAVVELTTKDGILSYRDPSPGTTTYRPLPILKPQLFYSPKYNVASSVTVPDYRATIYWEPNITTDQNGNAHLSFYTSDIAGKYTVKIAGVDVNGGIGDASIKLNPKAATGL
ncbi:hypothetical protein [Mucilaginibacter sp. dw_454]|uniref:hypothetical protein n=1 Tax=Mucilaginibacter sp. dw_454 TaxID=2720079 RepID=UPI001BD595DB|nr:hypothetical protein [Mucilaginibacter sp. dw_454]